MGFLPSGGSGTGGGGVTQLSYVELTSTVNIVSTTEGTPTDVITSAAVTVDGSTVVCLEFYAATFGTSASNTFVLNFWEDTTNLGRFWVEGGSSQPTAMGIFGRRFYTPAAGSHTWKVRGWGSPSATSMSVIAASGGAANMPAYLRVTKGG